MMKPTFYKLGLIGHPLEKSLSPAIHQAALRASGLKGEYHLYPVLPLPDGQADLAQKIEQLRQGALHGLNVTIPHKQNVLPFLDDLTPAAKAVGAANTLYLENGILMGDNTDIPGFSADLKRLLPGEPGYALVLGAGGAARAVVYALLQSGWIVTVAARRPEQAHGLLQTLDAPDSFQAVRLQDLSLQAMNTFKLIINATPVGMLPHPEDSPWPVGVPLPQQALLYDLVYKPPETRFMRYVLQAGLQAANGLGMLVEQGALSFERWTGRPVDRTAIWAAVSPGQSSAW
jgi:shikimate dehydrogenase